MRFFSVLFAFYLAILACLPCADKAVMPLDSARTYVNIASHESDGPLSHTDWCTPLCQCHCCSGTSLPSHSQVSLTAPTVALTLAARFARLAPPAARQRPGSIWQPPQA
jgi:hypothetical protein